MVVADSSVLITWLRASDSEVSRVVDSLLQEDRLAVVGVVLAEVLQGARTDFEFNALSSRMDALHYIDAPKNAFVDAARTASRLRESGLQIPLDDVLIAELAKQHDLPVYTIDRHFEWIPDLKLYSPAA